eukprot:4026886-Lingulodinium_polyedra.AAC.1
MPRAVLREAPQFVWGSFVPGERPPKVQAAIMPRGASVTFVTLGVKYMVQIAQDAKHDRLREEDAPNCFEVDRCFARKAPVRHDVARRALIEAEVCSKRDW